MLLTQKRSFLITIYTVTLLLTSLSCSSTLAVRIKDPNIRSSIVDQYLAEFCSPSLMESVIGDAIKDVLLRLPDDALTVVLDRRRPVLFMEVYSSGTARFASSSEVIMTKKDKPAFQEGMTIIRISDALQSYSPETIKGIIAHELAHRVLDHIRNNHVSCKAEREANRAIKAWGFVKEYESASQNLGQAKVGNGVITCKEDTEL